ncbi:MAG: hypothetical protein ABWY08_01955, partial [Comamonas sp.]
MAAIIASPKRAQNEILKKIQRIRCVGAAFVRGPGAACGSGALVSDQAPRMARPEVRPDLPCLDFDLHAGRVDLPLLHTKSLT